MDKLPSLTSLKSTSLVVSPMKNRPLDASAIKPPLVLRFSSWKSRRLVAPSAAIRHPPLVARRMSVALPLVTLFTQRKVLGALLSKCAMTWFVSEMSVNEPSTVLKLVLRLVVNVLATTLLKIHDAGWNRSTPHPRMPPPSLVNTEAAAPCDD